jgi:hypothetical protein
LCRLCCAPGESLNQEEPRKMKKKQRLSSTNLFYLFLIQDEVASLDSIWRAEMDGKVTLCLARAQPRGKALRASLRGLLRGGAGAAELLFCDSASSYCKTVPALWSSSAELLHPTSI